MTFRYTDEQMVNQEHNRYTAIFQPLRYKALFRSIRIAIASPACVSTHSASLLELYS